jgi:hypothetical protein
MNDNINDKTKVLLLLIVVIIFLCYMTYNMRHKTKSNEGFYTYYGNYKNYCSDCNLKTRSECSNCSNCGFCVTNDGIGKCVPGRKYGASYKKDCVSYEMQDPFYYNNELNIPNDRDIYPYFRYNIRNL